MAAAECEAAKATSTSAVQEAQTNSGAMQAAQHKIQQLDSECAQLKAEITMLRRDKETLTLEVRKLQGTASFSGDRLSSTESEVRRVKAQAQVRSEHCYGIYIMFRIGQQI